ncbi:MAG: hypothetical protein KAX49_16880 [Halanaerobiales bacterium]|nr:hypothetical protein [Halanaerobiales bacterium]
MKNILKAIIIIIVLFIIIFIVINIISFLKLYIFHSKISKLYFTPYYIAKIKTGENDVDVYIDYMEKNGWQYMGRMGGLMKFEKNDKILEVTNKQIKTVLILD